MQCIFLHSIQLRYFFLLNKIYFSKNTYNVAETYKVGMRKTVVCVEVKEIRRFYSDKLWMSNKFQKSLKHNFNCKKYHWYFHPLVQGLSPESLTLSDITLLRFSSLQIQKVHFFRCRKYRLNLQNTVVRLWVWWCVHFKNIFFVKLKIRNIEERYLVANTLYFAQVKKFNRFKLEQITVAVILWFECLVIWNVN